MARKAVKNVANRVGLKRVEAPVVKPAETRPKVCRYCKHSYGPRCKVHGKDEYFMCKCSVGDEWSKFVDSDTCDKFEYRPANDSLNTKIE